MSHTWKALPQKTHGAAIPTLLYKYDMTPTGYALLLTDLTSVWSEALDYAQVLQRATRNDTSVDPSEDPEQFKVLLERIRDSLNGCKDSKLWLSKSSHGRDLQLSATITLPRPLQPLKWTIYLSPASQSTLTRELLFPCLRHQAIYKNQVSSLIEKLKEKDHLLGKLLDTLERSGVDLSNVFPGTAGLRSNKGSSFSRAAKNIKGVTPFDEKLWRTESASTGSGETLNLVDELSARGMPLSDLANMDLAHDEWWNDLPPHGASDSLDDRAEPSLRESSVNRRGDTQQSDGDFQRQETPPALRSAMHDKSTPDIDVDAMRTISRSPDNAGRPTRMRSTSPSHTTNPTNPRKGKKPGVIGISNAAAKRMTPKSPEPEDQTDSDSEAAGTITDHGRHKGPLQLPSPQPKHSGRLGTIGGKMTQRISETPSSQTAEEIGSPRSKRQGRLGTIGGKDKKTDTESSPKSMPAVTRDHIDEGPRGPPDSQQAEAGRPSKIPEGRYASPENPEGKANRKREELKRQIEAQSKAPLKKKRKF